MKHPLLLPRLLPARRLPPYSYVSGKSPHPTRDPQGHSYGAVEPQFAIDREKEWRGCESYLWGIDLFNHGYYWEAHETWEAVWHAAGRKGAIADFCKALIKLAAAGVKAREGRPEGVKRHSQRAKQLLQSVTSECGDDQSFMGLSIPTLMQHAYILIGDPTAIVKTSDEPVVVVMPFVLSTITSRPQ
jgi:predicted metal-dependent hydrolase